jgi:ubiquinol-cytochrome c reductase cytochrome c1 subunit
MNDKRMIKRMHFLTMTTKKLARKLAKKLILSALCLAWLSPLMPAMAASEEGKPHIHEYEWSFEGPLGKYDDSQLQRGFKVYREVCAACHSMNLVSFRNLGQPGALGYSEDQIKSLAAEYTVMDGPDSDGEMFERPARPSDRFPSPYANKQAAIASNGGAYPPDFSLLAKARFPYRGFPTFVFDIFTQYAEGGPDYIVSLLTGYQEAPAGVEAVEGAHYNPYFANGNWIKMAQPISDDQVEYPDGTPTTLEQYAKDVAAFMMWAAEPKLEERKQMGFNVMIFLGIFAVLLYLAKRKIWSSVAH